MPESIHEQVAAATVNAFKTKVISDDGATYWYTPDAVIRFNTIESDLLLQSDFGNDDSKPTTVYVLAPAPEGEESAEDSTEKFTKTVHFDLLLAQEFKTEEMPPDDQTAPIRWTVQNRLMRDAERAITLDTTLGDLVINIEIPIRHRDGRETFVPGWAVVFARIVAVYDHTPENP